MLTVLLEEYYFNNAWTLPAFSNVPMTMSCHIGSCAHVRSVSTLPLLAAGGRGGGGGKVVNFIDYSVYAAGSRLHFMPGKKANDTRPTSDSGW